MNLVFTPEAWQDYLYWQATDVRQVKRINLLLKEIAREPFAGIGKPEPLKHEYQAAGHAGLMASTGWFTK